MEFKEFLEEKNHFFGEKEICLSPRFGNGIKWKIKGISEDQFRNTKKSGYDQWCSLCIAAIVFPKLEDKELWESYGADSPEGLLKEMLYPGEYNTLLNEVKIMNGFSERKRKWKAQAKKP